jgi:homoserine O-succinyltransferase
MEEIRGDLAGRLAATLNKLLKGRLRTPRRLLSTELGTAMPIKIPDQLPATETLIQEGVRVMTESAAIRQDIRPLQIGLLNLMPNKVKTELQLARLIGASPLQIELTLLRIGSHQSRNTAEEHLLKFYETWEEVRHRKFDGLIITGAPVEHLAYEEVSYWSELQQIFEWSTTNVHSTLAVCWGAMAALYHFHEVPKHMLTEKAFGVFRPKILAPTSPYLSGFSDNFSIPISRWAEIRPEDIARSPDLTLLAASDAAGVCMVGDSCCGRLYVLDHLEYDSTSLADEYFRDVAAKVEIKPPLNYFPDNDPNRPPRNRWRSHAHLLFANWINEIYQTVPFESEHIGRAA